jgi:hypothetical protein
MRYKFSETSPLSGPEVVKICTTSTQGPFAKNGMKIDLPSTQVCCTNTRPKTVNIEHLVLEPLRHLETGVKVDSNITSEAVPMVLSPGESAVVTISGFIPAKPGTYTSSFRVAPKEESSLAIDIEYQVAAHIAWGLLCMFFGLLIIGFINVLDNESGVKGVLRHAIVARQNAHELIQLTPPPQSSAAQIYTINHEFDSAIAVLKKPREPSFVDHRSADADEHLKIAANLTDELHKASQKPR